MMNFCTIFDSYYLDKGITLADSLQLSCPNEFNLFIFCFDDKCHEVLSNEKLPGVTVLSYKDLEDYYPILPKLKKERSKAEYCWTCTPASIEYVLHHFDVDSCTYIDADLYFFQNPEILFKELSVTVTASANKNIIITPHRFTNSPKDMRLQNRSGKYCVEFNYFDKSENATKALTWWRDKCFEWCFHLYEPTRMGDQKYLEQFPSLFEGVHELKNLGGGMAPWNLNQYKYLDDNENATTDSKEKSELKIPKIMDKSTGEIFTPVFYHFQDIRYLPGRKVNIKSYSHDKKLKKYLYIPYLRNIEENRHKLKEKYNIDFSIHKAYSNNPLIAFIQKYILMFKTTSLSDIFDLNKIYNCK